MAIATTPPYTPTPPTIAPKTEDGRNLADWVMRELQKLSVNQTDQPRFQMQPISAPPPTPRDGLVAITDGVNWKPSNIPTIGIKRSLFFHDGFWSPLGLETFFPIAFITPNSATYNAQLADHGNFINSNGAGGTLTVKLPSANGIVTPTGYAIGLYMWAANDIIVDSGTGGSILPPGAQTIHIKGGSQGVVILGCEGGGTGAHWTTLHMGVPFQAGANHLSGLVPDPGAGGGTTRFLREDGGFANPPTVSGSLVNIITYSGSQTITIPAAATQGYVQEWGATGGSGSENGGVSGATGAGGYLEKLLTGLTGGLTLVYTQGGAGAGGVGGAGGNGGTTTLASGSQAIGTLTCNGSNGTTNSTAGVFTAGSAGGTASGGDINISGQRGGSAATGMVGLPPGGRNFFSVGADGQNAVANGNAGNPGGLKIAWYS